MIFLKKNIYLHHEGVWRMDKVGQVALRSTLKAKLTVRSNGVVHEDNRVGQPAVVQHFAVVLTQLVLFRFKPELVLVPWSQAMHGTHLVRAQGFTEQVNGRHLTSKHSLLIDVRRGADVTLVKWLQTTQIQKAAFDAFPFFKKRDIITSLKAKKLQKNYLPHGTQN